MIIGEVSINALFIDKIIMKEIITAAAKKNAVKLTAAQQNNTNRCFLPDLTELGAAC